MTDNGAVVVVSADGNGGAVFSDTGKIDVQVVYTYAAIVTPGGGNLDIPEPATFALLGSGVLGIGVIGRADGRVLRRSTEQSPAEHRNSVRQRSAAVVEVRWR